jgi:hypothetical protein
MTISNYPNGFPKGVAIQQYPFEILRNASAKVFWVDSVRGSDLEGINLGTFQNPYGTIEYANSQCTANQGDVIIVAPTHVENVSATGSLTLDVAGVTVLFLGNGSARGQIQFTTATSARVIVSAADVTLINPLFIATLDALDKAISVTGNYFSLINGEFRSNTDVDFEDCLDFAASVTHGYVDGWVYVPSNEGGLQKNSFVDLSAGCNNVILKNVYARGDFADGVIRCDDCLDLQLENCILNNTNATPKPGIVLGVNSTGWAKNVDIRVASGTTFVSSVAKLNWDKQCLGYNTDGKGGTDIATFA